MVSQWQKDRIAMEGLRTDESRKKDIPGNLHRQWSRHPRGFRRAP
jgi:hypothetical protein